MAKSRGADPIFLRACRMKKTPRAPIWLMRQAGRYMKEYRALRTKHSILDLAKTPELACTVTLQPIRAFGMDAAILFSDLLIPIEPLGFRLRFCPGPIIDNPVRGAQDVRRLPKGSPGGPDFTARAVRLAARELGATPLIGFCGAPFTVASYLIEGGPSKDFLKTKSFMESESPAWDALMRILVLTLGDHLAAQIDAGCAAAQIFDSWAGALSPDQYRRKVLPYSRDLIAAARGRGVPVIHFGTGTAGFLKDFAATGSDVVGVDWRLDIADACRALPGQAVQGNLDPAVLAGAVKPLGKAAREILRAAGRRRGFIFNLGHGVLPQTPEDNVRRLVDLVRAQPSE
ncbi:MAG: uroporphyrinogen decarboxylase [Elusimicrobiota bacterium]